MALELRDARHEDLDALLALNNSAGPGILPVDAQRLAELLDFAPYFRIAEVDGVVAGFLIALDAHSEYDSLNYRWFQDRFPAFVYIDRIVIGRPFRRLGLGRVFYADVQSFSEVRSPLLACEVFLDPRDDVSVLFHGTYGFREEGQQTLPSGHRVSLLVKELCSFPWVRQHYSRDGVLELPLQPWLTARPTVRRQARAQDNAA